MKAAIGLMVEGQFGLNWDRWTRVLDMAERAGYQCVFRSDHFTNPAEPDLDSLELFTSLTYAATRTKRIEFGSLVAPVTFRHPTMTVRQAAAIGNTSANARRRVLMTAPDSTRRCRAASRPSSAARRGRRRRARA